MALWYSISIADWSEIAELCLEEVKKRSGLKQGRGCEGKIGDKVGTEEESGGLVISPCLYMYDVHSCAIYASMRLSVFVPLASDANVGR